MSLYGGYGQADAEREDYLDRLKSYNKLSAIQLRNELNDEEFEEYIEYCQYENESKSKGVKALRNVRGYQNEEIKDLVSKSQGVCQTLRDVKKRVKQTGLQLNRESNKLLI